MKKNDVIELKIEELNNLGYGVGFCGGKTVFVSGACDGDTARVRIIKDNRTYAVGRAEEILSPSPDRVPPACPVSASCGGCAYAAVSYEHERELKRKTVKSALRHEGLSGVLVEEVVSDGRTEGYRNKAMIQFGLSPDGRVLSGFFAPKTHRIVPSAGCLLHPPLFSEIAAAAAAFLADRLSPGAAPFPIRCLYLRAAASGLSLVTVTRSAGVETAKKLTAFLTDRFSQIVTSFYNVNDGEDSTVLGEKTVLLSGPGYLEDVLCGNRLKISPLSFYQINRPMAERLYRKGRDLLALTGKETLCDLYCGIGSIGLSMKGDFARLVGVEIVESAVSCAAENAAANGVANAAFCCGDAGILTETLSVRPDAVILDPPRKGCSRRLIEYLTDTLAPQKILYISCNPATFARDARLFWDRGYTFDRVYPYDLFPRTGHVECVTLMTKNR